MENIGMKLNNRIGMITAAAASTLLAGAASAQGTFSTTGNNTAWRNVATWSYTGSPAQNYPTTGDTVTIGHSVTVGNSDACAVLTINSAKILTISSAGTLTLDSSGTATINGRLTINGGEFVVNSGAVATVVGSTGGVLLMDGSTPTLRINAADGVVMDNAGTALFLVDADPISGPDAFIVGTGNLKSNHASHAIDININQFGDDVELELNGVGIDGTLTFLNSQLVGNALVRNGGYLLIAGTVNLDSSLAGVSDVASSSCATDGWHVPGRLVFNVGGSLAAAFVVGGDLDINATVSTSDDLNLVSGGCINVGSGATFGFGGLCGGGCNPGTNPLAPGSYCCP
jgi:hypothetical protein